MTGAEFRSHYRLIKQVTPDGVITHHALDANEHVVMVHFLGPTSAEPCKRVRTALGRLGPVDQQRILSEVEVDGGHVVVTQFIQGFESLERWLERRVTPAPAAGEFTQMFGGAAGAPVPPETSDPARTAASEPPQAPPTSPTPRQEGGDFTLLFSGAEPKSTPSNAAPPPKAPASPPRPTGEFTQLFSAAENAEGPQGTQDEESEKSDAQSSDKPKIRWRDPTPPGEPQDRPKVRWKQDAPPPSAPAPSPPPGTARPASGPGEFPRTYPRDRPGPVNDSPSGPLPLDAPAGMGPERPAASQEPGEFTKMFRPPSGDPITPPPSRPPARDSTDYLRNLRESGESVDEPPAAPAAPTPDQPGEFTRLMSGLDVPAAPDRPGGVTPAPPPPPSPSPRGPAAAPARSGPGEFTRIVSGIPAPQAAPQPATPPPLSPAQSTPGTEGRRSKALLWVLLAAGTVTVVALVLYFALR